MIARLHGLLLDVFGWLPRGVRRRIVRVLAPTFTVGAICVIERDDGHVVLIRQRYRNGWGLPGGLLTRGEAPEDAVRREAREELGVDVELVGEPAVVVDAELRRVDVVFRARLAVPASPLSACSPEIVAVEWHPLSALPAVQTETASALGVLGSARRQDR